MRGTASFRLEDVKTGVGAALGADINLGHGLPLTGTAGLAHGLANRGETRRLLPARPELLRARRAYCAAARGAATSTEMRLESMTRSARR